MKKSVKYIDIACDTDRKKENLFKKFLSFFNKDFEEFEKISWNDDNSYKLYYHDRHNTKLVGWVFVSDYEVTGSNVIMFIDKIKTNKFFGELVKNKLDSKHKKEYVSSWQTKQEEIINEDRLEVLNF